MSGGHDDWAIRAIPRRSEIAPEHTWDLASIYPGRAEWESECRAVARDMEALERRFRGRLGDDAATLLSWLDLSNDVLRRVWTIGIYAMSLHDVDTADNAAKEMDDSAMSLESRASATLSFAEPEILALGQTRVEEWMGQNPGLAVYRHYFDSLFRQAPHVRSAEVEQVLGLVQDPFSAARATHSVLDDADMRFTPAHTSAGEPVEIAQGTISALLQSPDRELRRTAWESYADAHLALRNGLANCLSTGVKQDVFTARVRGYGSSLQAALEPHNIPVDVFHTLIDAFERHLTIWHKYWRIMREGLGYDRLHPYDAKAPLAAVPPRVPYDTAVEWISRGLAPLGDEYVSRAVAGITRDRWVDPYPNQNKRGGAYSNGVQGTIPLILMSYTDDIESMSTLAHELGHSMHSYLSWASQPTVYSEYSTFAAEVASNFNQALVRAYLLATSDDPDFQIGVIDEAMSNFHRYLFVMPTLARFELAIHERVERDEALTADILMSVMADLFAQAYGPEVSQDRERVGITWAQFPTHLYSNFYVFQYATGISAANALAQGVLRGDGDARDRYLAFLRSGGSLDPLDALHMAGVDMRASGPVDMAFEVMDRMIDRLPGLIRQRADATAAERV